MGCSCSTACGEAPPIPRRGLDSRRNSTSSRASVVSGRRPSNVIVENPGRIRDSYRIGDEIGRGAYGCVSCATKKGQGEAKKFAVKTIAKEARHVERFKQEIDIMKTLDHPNIIRLAESFEDQGNIYLVMERCDGGPLSDSIAEAGRFPEVQAAIVMEQLLRAMHCMHGSQICHRDLKPQNLLFQTHGPIEQRFLKVIDFGLSCRFENEQVLTTKAGTCHYIAPQVLAGRYDFKSDLWSCGVILFELLCGYRPFEGETEVEVLSKVRLGKFSFSQGDRRDVSEDAKGVVRMLLKMNPLKRYSAEQALSTEWIENKAPRTTEQVIISMDVADHLRNFRSQSKFKQAALHIIAGQLGDEQVRAQCEAFRALDANGDGVLSTNELHDGLMQAGCGEIVEDLQQIVEDGHSHNSGVDLPQFLAATFDKKQYMQPSVVWDVFKIFDRNGDGMISISELKDSLGNGPGVCSSQAIEELINEADRHCNGEIDFQEFMTMVQ